MRNFHFKIQIRSLKTNENFSVLKGNSLDILIFNLNRSAKFAGMRFIFHFMRENTYFGSSSSYIKFGASPEHFSLSSKEKIDELLTTQFCDRKVSAK